jgi:phospholipase/carboxylesterase
VPDVPPPLVVEPDAPARVAVIFLHGLGADGRDFADFPALLGLHGVRYVFPHAPVRPVTLNGGLPMRAWFDIVRLVPGGGFDRAGMEESVRTVERLLGEEAAHGVPAEKTILGGFSQGGAVALYAALTRGWPLAGAVGLSTFLPSGLPRAETPRPVPVFLAHGRTDPVVDFRLGEETRDALLRSGHDVLWWTHGGGHTVDRDEIDALARWIGRRLAVEPRPAA